MNPIPTDAAPSAAPDSLPPLWPVGVIESQGAASALLSAERQRLLSLLEEPDSAAGLARKIGVARQKVNYHLRELERTGLVEPVATRRRGNCIERLVRARARRFVIAPSALGLMGEIGDVRESPALDSSESESGRPRPAGAAERLSWALLVQIAGRLLRDLAHLRRRADETRARLPVIALETELRLASPREFETFAGELGDAVAQVMARYHDDSSPRGRRFRIVLGAHPTLGQKSHNKTDNVEEQK